MNLAASLKLSARTLLDGYTENKGVSTDPYNDQHQFHPMAEGKYLLALAALTRSEIITRTEFVRLVKQSLERLSTHSIPMPIGHAYGLNFSYDGIPADEPYVITTAVIAHGLLDCEELLADSVVLQQLIAGCLQYLDSVECLPVSDKGDVSAPVYSPHNRMIIYNAVAYWTMVLHKAHRLTGCSSHETTKKVAEWLAQDCLNIPGWPYARDSTRYDLIHACLVLNSLIEILPSQSIEKMAIPVLAHFTVIDGYIDKFESVNHEDAITRCTKSGAVFPRFYPDYVIVYHNEPARAWALGEMLVFMAAMAEKGHRKAYWTTMMKRTTAAILDKMDSNSDEGDLDKPWFRYTMFLAHGFTRVLEVMRKS